MAPIARFTLVALDCPDPDALAAFYAAITGWEPDRVHPSGQPEEPGDWVQLKSDQGATIAFQRAPGHQPPAWPSDQRPQQAHLDFDVDDLDVGEQQVLALGARKAEHQPDEGPDEGFRVYLDPAGHPFCLVLA